MPNDSVFVSAVDHAYDVIKTKILNGELKPGQQLSKRKMAELAGVSVIPIVDALNRLTEDGLVETKPRWGSYVTVYTPEKIEDLYILREALECQVIRILARTMTQEQYADCLRLANKLDAAKYNDMSAKEISEFHYEFHTKLVHLTGYPSLKNALKRCNLVWMLHAADVTGKRRRELDDDWHKQLLDAIMERDADKAEALMRVHVYDSFQEIIQAHGKKEGAASPV